MRKLRSIVFTASVILFVFTMVTYVACTKDACKNIVCQNGGNCVDGKCNCPTGYSGTNCEIKVDSCQNGGTCVDGKCKCPDGYEGDYCEIEARQKFLKT